MIKNLRVIIFLFAIGIIGGFLPILLNRDGISLIIIGFGFGVIQLYIKIQEGFIDKKYYNSIKILMPFVSLTGILLSLYNIRRFSSGYTRVLTIGFIILMLWETFIIYEIIKDKTKK